MTASAGGTTGTGIRRICGTISVGTPLLNRPEMRVNMHMDLRNLFWLLVVATICLFGFFAATGAWSPTASPGTGIAVGVLVLLWAAHAYLLHRRHDEVTRDPRLRHDRERRGF
jgi:membrane protein YdbS with pleckstrin-like domain